MLSGHMWLEVTQWIVQVWSVSLLRPGLLVTVEARQQMRWPRGAAFTENHPLPPGRASEQGPRIRGSPTPLRCGPGLSRAVEATWPVFQGGSWGSVGEHPRGHLLTHSVHCLEADLRKLPGRGLWALGLRAPMGQGSRSRLTARFMKPEVCRQHF